jgi:hypothetical protein
MDTDVEAAIHVYKQDGTIISFNEYENGLYFHDVKETLKSKPKTDTNAYSFILTVDANKGLFHRREVERADQARSLYKRIGRPSQKFFEHILDKNLIRNCPITVEDAKRAVLIYGSDTGALQGKLTKTAPEHVPTLSLLTLPDSILQYHREVTVCIDIFYVNGILFFHSISRKLKVRSVSNITSKDKNTLLRETLQVVKTYKDRGFEVVNIHADMEFQCIAQEMQPIHFDITPNDAHVPEVERSIRTIKERVRADINDMPFKRLPKLMTIELVRRAVKCLNQFPVLDGVSATISPFTIITGRPNPNYDQMTLDFGTYVQVYEDNDKATNSTMPRSTGAIALNPTGNILGDHFFMSLNTGRRLSRRQ